MGNGPHRAATIRALRSHLTSNLSKVLPFYIDRPEATLFIWVRSPSECTDLIPGDLVEDVRAMVCGRRLVVVGEPLVGGGVLRERSVSTHHSHSSHNLLTQHENILEMMEPHFCTYCTYYFPRIYTLILTRPRYFIGYTDLGTVSLSFSLLCTLAAFTSQCLSRRPRPGCLRLEHVSRLGTRCTLRPAWHCACAPAPYKHSHWASMNWVTLISIHAEVELGGTNSAVFLQCSFRRGFTKEIQTEKFEVMGDLV